MRGEVLGRIAAGLVVLVAVGRDDGEADVAYLADKVLDLRILPDEVGRMNRSAVESGCGLLVVSQFTLYGDARRGRRPSYSEAAAPEDAQRLYQLFVERLRPSGLPVVTGIFRETMELALVNDGPVTILLDSRRLF